MAQGTTTSLPVASSFSRAEALRPRSRRVYHALVLLADGHDATHHPCPPVAPLPAAAPLLAAARMSWA
jgi:hypothetical protein